MVFQRGSNSSPDIDVPETLTFDCSTVANGSRIPHPESCHFWFWCLNGNSQIFWCGQEALFDTKTNTCTRDTLAQCYVAPSVVSDMLEEKEFLGDDEIDKEFGVKIEEQEVKQKFITIL